MTQQGDAVAGKLATEKVGIKGYLAFFLTIIFFSGVFSGTDSWWRVFDFSVLNGSFGQLPGANGATTNLLPNVVMAFVIIQALKITGLLDWVGHICEPVMALWGLPGEAATVLLAALMSMGGAVGVAASLATAGALTGHDVTVLLPAMYLMGNPVQNVGRCLGTAEVNAKYYPHIITVCVINALLSIWVMQLIV